MPLGCAQIGKGEGPVMELEDIGSKHTLSTWDGNRGPNVALETVFGCIWY